MKEGIILKGYSGFYYVKWNNIIYECSLRGKNRLKKIRFLPGDFVEFESLPNEKGVIDELLPRRNELIRPPIANVDQVIIVTSLINPDLWLIDRLTVLALWNDVQPIICFNKCDQVNDDIISDLLSIYQKTQFPLVVTSAKKRIGIEELKKILENRISVFAGPSGVGKSSIINAIEPGFQLKTGEISEKLKRGKHTTRHVELLPLSSGGLVADTPGFSSLVLPPDIVREDLPFLFPEFEDFRRECKFSTCLHKSEPQCSVRQAVSEEKISKSRYDNYLSFLEEVIKQERSF
ncbi:MAG: ribosome small subunit-dependent GTPase A [Clostridia bacterium]|nr:ribosome small subunit-dependent GTPase A [Clostridia bacterium]